MLISVLLAAAAAAPAPAPVLPQPQSVGEVVVNPDWAHKPTEMEIAEFYPLLPSLLGIEGQAAIVCTVSLSGMLENCSVESEAPEGNGFGAAALKAARVMRMRPAMRGGRPVPDFSVRIPLAFRPGSAAASLPGLTESLACYGRFSARLKADPGDTTAARGAEWSGYWANKLMKLERISKAFRDKRLAAAAARLPAPPPRNDSDARCEAAFLPSVPT